MRQYQREGYSQVLDALYDVYEKVMEDIHADLYETVAGVVGFRPDAEMFEDALESYHNYRL